MFVKEWLLFWVTVTNGLIREVCVQDGKLFTYHRLIDCVTGVRGFLNHGEQMARHGDGDFIKRKENESNSDIQT